MVDAVFEFLYRDHDSRWRALTITMGAGFLFGSALNLLLAIPAQNVCVDVLVLMAVAYCGQVWLYATRRSASPRAPEAQPARLVSRRRLYPVAAGITAISICASKIDSIQASILGTRLKRIPLHDGSAPIEQAARILMQANTSQIRITGTTLDEFASLIGQVADQMGSPGDSWRSLSILLRGDERAKHITAEFGVLTGHEPETDRPPCDSAHEGHLIGTVGIEHGQFTAPETKTREYWPRVITNCTLKADGRVIDNTWISYSVIEYKGGPLVLRNVRFDNSRIDLPFGQRPSRAQMELLAQLITRNVVWLKMGTDLPK